MAQPSDLNTFAVSDLAQGDQQKTNSHVATRKLMRLFPLPAHILPQGKMPLRVFEPRYIRLVKEVMRENSSFAICMYQTKSSGIAISPIATEVNIVDFTSLPDGLLGVTVQASQCVLLQDFYQAADKLWMAQATTLPAWPHQPITEQDECIKQALQQLEVEYPDLKQRYETAQWQNSAWLAYRWLEHLPLEVSEKQTLLSQHSAEPTLALLRNWLQK